MKEHVPVIRKPTPEELDAAIAHAESRGWYGLLGMLKDYKQLRLKWRCKMGEIVDICRIIDSKDLDFKAAKTPEERENVRAEVRALFDEAWAILNKRMEGYHRTIVDELSGR